MQIMDAAQDASYKKLIVAGEPLNKKAQKELENLQNTAEQTAQPTQSAANTLNGASTPLPSDNQYENWSE